MLHRGCSRTAPRCTPCRRSRGAAHRTRPGTAPRGRGSRCRWAVWAGRRRAPGRGCPRTRPGCCTAAARSGAGRRVGRGRWASLAARSEFSAGLPLAPSLHGGLCQCTPTRRAAPHLGGGAGPGGTALGGAWQADIAAIWVLPAGVAQHACEDAHLGATLAPRAARVQAKRAPVDEGVEGRGWGQGARQGQGQGGRILAAWGPAEGRARAGDGRQVQVGGRRSAPRACAPRSTLPARLKLSLLQQMAVRSVPAAATCSGVSAASSGQPHVCSAASQGAYLIVGPPPGAGSCSRRRAGRCRGVGLRGGTGRRAAAAQGRGGVRREGAGTAGGDSCRRVVSAAHSGSMSGPWGSGKWAARDAPGCAQAQQQEGQHKYRW